MNNLQPNRDKATAQGRRHLAVYFPWLPAERLIRTRVAPPDTAFALVEKQKGAMRLVAVSQAAHLMGLSGGLALADARARVPELLAFDYDRVADEALLERLAEACLRYTPKVMLDHPQGLLLDITGCAHLFDKGESELAADLQHRLTSGGYTATFAFSASSDAAMALAIYGLDEGQVARLPVSAPLSHGESDAYALPWCQWRIRRTTCLRHLESRSDRCLWPRRLRWPARSRVRRPPPDSAGRLRRVPPTYNRYVSSPFHTNTSVAIRTAE